MCLEKGKNDCPQSREQFHFCFLPDFYRFAIVRFVYMRYSFFAQLKIDVAFCFCVFVGEYT